MVFIVCVGVLEELGFVGYMFELFFIVLGWGFCIEGLF